MHKMVVHCKKHKYDIYIGRGSVWGNPFPMKNKSQEEREKVIGLYRNYLLLNSDLIEKAKKELKNKVLGCWCAPEDCHGDILAKIANDEGEW